MKIYSNKLKQTTMEFPNQPSETFSLDSFVFLDSHQKKAPFLKLYTKYCKEYNVVMNNFKELKAENKKFRDLVYVRKLNFKILKKLERTAIEDGRQNIASYLIMPVQRFKKKCLNFFQEFLDTKCYLKS
jgi:hypothetical protein